MCGVANCVDADEDEISQELLGTTHTITRRAMIRQLSAQNS